MGNAEQSSEGNVFIVYSQSIREYDEGQEESRHSHSRRDACGVSNLSLYDPLPDLLRDFSFAAWRSDLELFLASDWQTNTKVQ